MHLLDPTVRRMTDKALLDTMDSCLIVARMAALNPAFHMHEAWIHGLGEYCCEELDRRRLARKFQEEELRQSRAAIKRNRLVSAQIQRSRSVVRRDPLIAAFFGGIGGAAPDAERREGYPTDQPNSPETLNLSEDTRRNPADQVSRGQGRREQTVPPAS